MGVIPADALSAPIHGFHSLHGRALQEGTSQRSVFGVGISFAIITTIVIGLRIYVRVSLVQGGLGADDCELYVRVIARKPTNGTKYRSHGCWSGL